MTDRHSDRAIAQAFYEQYQESLRAGIKAHMGFWDGVFAKAKRIDAAAPDFSDPALGDLCSLPNIVRQIRNFADVADDCRITEVVNSIPAMRTWADMIESHINAAPEGAQPIGYFDPDVLAHLADGNIDPVGVLRRKPNNTSTVPIYTQPQDSARDREDAEPDVALLISMATCLNHGFGLLDESRQQSMLHDMRKLWDEVKGRGYYTPDRRDFYTSMIAARADGGGGNG